MCVVKYGEEHGRNLQKIAKKLAKNDNLIRLLINTDLDPLNHDDKVDGFKLINKNILFVPFLSAEDQTTSSKIVILYDEGAISTANPDNEIMSLLVTIYCPFCTWQITGDQLRPFAIMSEVRKTIQDKRINGLGEIQYKGFDLSSLTEEQSTYTMRFIISAFS